MLRRVCIEETRSESYLASRASERGGCVGRQRAEGEERRAAGADEKRAAVGGGQVRCERETDLWRWSELSDE